MSGPRVSLCRLCRESCDFSINIFNPNGTNGLLVWKILKELLQLDVCKDDGLPVTICSDCMSKVSEFKYFKTMCIKSRIEFLKASVNRGLVDSDQSQFEGLPPMKYFPPPDAESNVLSPAASHISAECRDEDPLQDRKPSIVLLSRRLALQKKESGSVPQKESSTNSPVSPKTSTADNAVPPPTNQKRPRKPSVDSLPKKPKTERSAHVSPENGSQDVPKNQRVGPRNAGSLASASQRIAGLRAQPAGISSTIQEAKGSHIPSPKVSASQDKLPKAPHPSGGHTASTKQFKKAMASCEEGAKGGKKPQFTPKTSDEEWKCGFGECGLVFNSKRARSIHISHKHPGGVSEANLGEAILSNKPLPPDESIIFSCKLCPIKFVSSEKFYMHMKMHYKKKIKKGIDSSDKLGVKNPTDATVHLDPAKKELRDQTVALPGMVEVGSPSASCHYLKWNLRECHVVLCDIVKSGAYHHLSCVNSECSSDDEPEESVPIAEAPERTSGDGIMKYFSPMAGVSPKASDVSTGKESVVKALKPIGIPKTPDLEKSAPSKASKTFGLLETPSSKKSVKRKGVRGKSSISDSNKTPSIASMFSISPKKSPICDTPVGSKWSTSPNTSPSSDSKKVGMLGVRELTISLEKLPNVLTDTLGVSPSVTVVCKSSPQHNRTSSDNDNVTAELGQSFLCALCSSAFATKMELHSHFKLQHEIKSVHTCGLCKMSFVGLTIYKAHMKTHKPEMKQPCLPNEKSDFEMHCCITLNHKKKMRKRILKDKCGKNQSPPEHNQCEKRLKNASVNVLQPSQDGEMDCNDCLKESFDGCASGHLGVESDSVRMNLDAVISRTSDEPSCVLSNATPEPVSEPKSADSDVGSASQPSPTGEDDLASKTCDERELHNDDAAPVPESEQISVNSVDLVEPEKEYVVSNIPDEQDSCHVLSNAASKPKCPSLPREVPDVTPLNEDSAAESLVGPVGDTEVSDRSSDSVKSDMDASSPESPPLLSNDEAIPSVISRLEEDDPEAAGNAAGESATEKGMPLNVSAKCNGNIEECVSSEPSEPSREEVVEEGKAKLITKSGSLRKTVSSGDREAVKGTPEISEMETISEDSVERVAEINLCIL